MITKSKANSQCTTHFSARYFAVLTHLCGQHHLLSEVCPIYISCTVHTGTQQAHCNFSDSVCFWIHSQMLTEWSGTFENKRKIIIQYFDIQRRWITIANNLLPITLIYYTQLNKLLLNKYANFNWTIPHVFDRQTDRQTILKMLPTSCVCIFTLQVSMCVQSAC